MTDPKPGKGTPATSRLLAVAPPSDAESWERQIRWAPKNKLTKDIGNLVVVFGQHPAWRGCLRWNELSLRAEWHRQPHWAVQRPLPFPPGLPIEHNEDLDAWAAQWIAVHYSTTFPATQVRGAIEIAARQNKYHPIRDYLWSCKWDLVPRLHSMASAYFGAEDKPAYNAALRLWMLSAVARAMVPGCKVDTMLVLDGGEGLGKTEAIGMLVGREWTHPSLPPLSRGDGTDTKQALKGHWVAIMDEMPRNNADAQRNFLTLREDVYRKSYGRDVERIPRMCVFVGTTNPETYHSDDQGRRYLPVSVGNINWEGIRRDRELLWGEAVALYGDGSGDGVNGQSWWDAGPESMAAIKAEQVLRRDVDEWMGVIERGLRDHAELTGEQVMRLVLPEAEKWTPRDTRRVTDIMRQLGWRRRKEGGSAVWIRKETK